MVECCEARILLILPYGGVGGMERVADTFYRTYRLQGHVVKVLKAIQLPNDVVNFGEDELRLSTRDLAEMRPLSRMLFYLTAPLRLRAYIKKHRITHSIAFGDVANLYSSMTFTGEFKVASIHSLKSVDLASRTLLTSLTKIGYRTFYRQFAKVVSISVSIREDLISNCNYAFADNLEVIYNPHDIDAIVEMGRQEVPESTREIFSKPVVIFLGRLSSPKTPWRLIRAFSRLLRDDVDANLIFVGDGDEKVVRRLKAMTAEAGLEARVFFLGRQNNPYRFLAKSTVLALTSAYEGTPNVIVESIALGIPVVSSYCTGGIAELMCVSGQVGTVVDSIQEVDAGFITPHYPEGVDDRVSGAIDELFAAALKRAIEEEVSCKQRTCESKDMLLRKFNPGLAAGQYIGAAQ